MFKKNDKVAVLSSWNNKGTVRIRRGTVHSCGRKVMRIEYASGAMAKVAFNPESNVMGAFNGVHIVADASDAELTAIALADGASVIEQNIARIDRTVAHYRAKGSTSDGYFASMAKDRAALEEAVPAVFFGERP